MRPVAPRIDGLDETMIAEDQHEFMTLAVARTEDVDGDVCTVTRWKPTQEERREIAEGRDIFITHLGTHLQPLQLYVGWPFGPAEGQDGR